jgi:flagellar protein FliS
MGDPYQAYVQNGVVGSNPLQLVIVLYETAIARTREAKSCLETGDVWGRAQAISKAVSILAQLIVSLNPEVGGDIGINLDRLYHYMQRRLQAAHCHKAVEPLLEVENLLCQLLESWYKVAEAERDVTSVSIVESEKRLEHTLCSYPGYLVDADPGERLVLSA